MKNLIQANEALNKMTANIKKAKEVRAESVQSAINEAIGYAKNNKEIFSTKKNAINVFCKEVFADKAVDAYTKRAVKIAKAILVDGYKMRKEILSIAQMEQLTKFKVGSVNEIMVDDDDMYLTMVKDLIASAKVQKTTKVFSASKAKNL